jgi:hypothetical protein
MNTDFGPFHTPVITPGYRGLPWWGLVTDPADDPEHDWAQPDEPPGTPPGFVTATASGAMPDAPAAAGLVCGVGVR